MVLGKSFEDNLTNLRTTFDRFRKYNLKLKPKKLFISHCNSISHQELTKQRLVSVPILSYPNAEDVFVLDADASGQAIGAVLSQIQND